MFICGDVKLNPGPVSNNLLKFCHWNANSLCTNEFQRIPLIQTYASIHNFHLICISESALKSSTPDKCIEIDGYTSIRSDLPNGDSHGGVVIYHKDDMAVKNRKDLNKKQNCLVLELSISRKKVFFILAYRKFGQTKEQFDTFIENFDSLLDEIEDENPHCKIMIGDYNSHCNDLYSKDKTDKYGADMHKLFRHHNMSQLVNQPTYRNSSGAKTCIDLLATDQPNLVLSNEIHPSLHNKCHHDVNFVKMNLKCPPPPSYERRVWHYARANMTNIHRSLNNYDWDQNLDLNLEQFPEKQAELFHQVLLNVSKNFIPSENKIINPKDPPWINKNLKNCYTKYRRKYKKFAKRNFPQSEKNEIDNLKEEFTNLVHFEKEKYLKRLGDQVSDPQAGQKSYWSALKKLMNSKITSVIPSILKN